jgi:hypothetical protein
MANNLSPYADKELQIRAAILQDMRSRWQPHRGQIPCRNALRDPNCQFIFLQCGRKFGKTDWLLHELVENCLLPRNRGEISFYVSYEADQAKEIAWLEQRALKMCDRTLVHKVYDTEMRIVFKNGRHLIHTGSNNHKAAAGKQPSMMGLDEFKDFEPKFWEVCEPNLAVYNAQTIFCGSPPDGPCQYTEVSEMVQELMKTGEGFYTRQPTWMNDRIPGLLKWLEKARKRYVLRGEEHIFLREYAALYIPGGRRQIFPMFDWLTVAKSRRWLKENVKKNAEKFNWYVIADPANDSVFAVLFAAVNPDTRDVYIVDVIYETDRNKTSARLMNDAIRKTCLEWNDRPDAWFHAYDDHESWFQVESQQLKNAPNWIPAGKYSQRKNTGVSQLKDCLLAHKFWVNVEADWLNTEFSNYCTDQNGKIPKGRDHTIDCARYLLIVSNWDVNEVEQIDIPDYLKNDPWLMTMLKLEEDIDSEELMEDWTHDMFKDWAEAPSFI